MMVIGNNFYNQLNKIVNNGERYFLNFVVWLRYFAHNCNRQTHTHSHTHTHAHKHTRILTHSLTHTHTYIHRARAVSISRWRIPRWRDCSSSCYFMNRLYIAMSNIKCLSTNFVGAKNWIFLRKVHSL